MRSPCQAKHTNSSLIIEGFGKVTLMTSKSCTLESSDNKFVSRLLLSNIKIKESSDMFVSRLLLSNIKIKGKIYKSSIRVIIRTIKNRFQSSSINP